jgi:capsular exopolysaccharide synthesis family protein
MKIERITNNLNVFNRPGNGDQLAGSDVLLKTEYESITKLETLYPVIDSFDLVKKWNLPGRQEAAAKLRANLETQANLRSDFVSIEYYDENPKDAADIANAVAESYMTKRLEFDLKKKDDALAIINKQIADLEKRSNESRLKMQAAKSSAGILGESMGGGGGMASNPGWTPQTAGETLEFTRQSEMYRLNRDMQTLESQIASLDTLQGAELVSRAAGLKIDNPVISSMAADYQKLLVELEGQTKAGLGRKHPTITALNARIEKSQEVITKAALEHLAGLKTRLESVRAERDGLEKFNAGEKKDVLDKQSQYNEYLVAKRDVETIDSQLVQLRMEYSRAELERAQAKTAATIWQSAEPQRAPAKPKVPLNLALGGVLGLMFGLGLAFLLEYMDTTVKSLDDVERFLGVPVLAVVPKDVGVLHRSSGFSPDAEAYRILRTNIEFNRKNPQANAITVVSGGAGEGKSTTLTNLAFVCAQGGYNVLLIDADLRRPRLHTLFDVSNTVGLTNYLTTDVRLEEVVIQTPVENLFFLPSGILPADSAGILNSQRMSELIDDVKSRFDLVLIDSPPILGVSDASVLANEADMTIIVVQHRKLPRQMLMRVKQAVENVGGNVLGVVLNNVDIRTDASYQYYTSYYTYYSPTNGEGAVTKRRKDRRPSNTKPAPRAAGASSVVERVTSGASSRPGGDIF